MEPSFHDGEYLIVDKLTYRFTSPSRGDVVVLYNPEVPSQLLIKRIVGMPGETVEIKGGELYINGDKLEETPEFALIPYHDSLTTVPQGEYFVIGDNRTATTGSHIFGPVPRKDIVGKTWLSYWPLRDWGLSPSYAATAK